MEVSSFKADSHRSHYYLQNQHNTAIEIELISFFRMKDFGQNSSCLSHCLCCCNCLLPFFLPTRIFLLFAARNITSWKTASLLTPALCFLYSLEFHRIEQSAMLRNTDSHITNWKWKGKIFIFIFILMEMFSVLLAATHPLFPSLLLASFSSCSFLLLANFMFKN